jgi:hypothetical protein
MRMRTARYRAFINNLVASPVSDRLERIAVHFV